MAPEVGQRSLGDLDLWCLIAHGGSTHHLVWDTFWSAGQVSLDIRAGLDDIARHIEGVARRLRDRKSVIQSNAAWNSAKADDHTPHLINSASANAGAVGSVDSTGERVLETGSDDQSNDASAELAKTLHGKHRSHHGSTPFSCCEFGCDDRGQWII